MERKICPTCNQRPVAVNCHHGDRVYYRKVCDVCSRAGKKHREIPAWYKTGYRKKPACERCGFKFKLTEQSAVFYADGNLKNNNHFNLKTVCLNCVHEVHRSKLPWRQGHLVPDF
jgi:hypothetical protein